MGLAVKLHHNLVKGFIKMTEYIPTVLFPELSDPAVAALKDAYSESDLGVHLEFADIPLDKAAEMLCEDKVDVVIAGIAHDTPTVLRTAIHGVNRALEPDKKRTITSFFVMEKEGEEPVFYADCAVHEYPDSNMLVTIAEQTSESVRDLGYEPVVAFLSLSTFGSAEHLTSVKKIKEAANKFKEKHPEIISYGEIQADAALNPDIFWKKAAKAGVEIIDGRMPNVFIFPDGVSGNISYKLMEQRAGYTAVGPLLHGTSKEIHDSSRGATTQSLAREAYYAGMLYKARHESLASNSLKAA